MNLLNTARCARHITLAVVALLVASGPVAAQWSDDFDSYAPGAGIIGNGGWAGWDDSRTPDADVSDEQAFSRGNSIKTRANTDVVQILLHLFRGADAQCRNAGDTNNDDRLDLADAVSLAQYLLGRGPEPAAPFPAPGVDPDGGAPLGCERGLPTD